MNGWSVELTGPTVNRARRRSFEGQESATHMVVLPVTFEMRPGSD